MFKEGSITEEKAILKISELFGSLGQNAIDYAFKMTEIPKFKFLNKYYNGLDENYKEKYLVERFAELAVREENVKATELEIKNVADKKEAMKKFTSKK